MKCPNCGTTDAGPGSFCMACGAKLPLPAAAVPDVASSQPSVLLTTPVVAPVIAARQSVNPVYTGTLKTLRRVSAGSVFKVTFVIYALLLGIFGCLFLVVPGLLGASLLGSLGGRDSGLALLSGGIVGTLIVYVLLVMVGAFVQGIVTAVAALIYNLVAGWVGGIEVDLME